jgi:Holliday junction resolvase RusA-like endonuclease
MNKGSNNSFRMRAKKCIALNHMSEVATIDPVIHPTVVAENLMVAHCVYLGEPQSKHRPRFGNGHVYTPTATKLAQQAIGYAVKGAMKKKQVDEWSAFGVRLVFYVKDEQRKDVDNMTKLVFDALTKIVWHDDSQVKELMAWKLPDKDAPRTDILVYLLQYGERKTVICGVCGKRFITHPSWTERQYCSRACSAKALRKSETVYLFPSKWIKIMPNLPKRTQQKSEKKTQKH